jgi:hypothetical protein
MEKVELDMAVTYGRLSCQADIKKNIDLKP